MQSRNFFTFGVNFNVLVNSVLVQQPINGGGIAPGPTAGLYITQDNNFLIAENGNNLITE